MELKGCGSVRLNLLSSFLAFVSSKSPRNIKSKPSRNDSFTTDLKASPLDGLQLRVDDAELAGNFPSL
ncbi:hypothetical protein COLO4_24773 [Corchorus olitorius]|uniref:Uncharacterized protein n=1 Tax=Corchorus olitorius TaxID=93759 RepID=A0A1R3I742_9ROSI|nr:hypothetical protein COLO4_24773 [Corchorus olitorius]